MFMKVTMYRGINGSVQSAISIKINLFHVTSYRTVERNDEELLEISYKGQAWFIVMTEKEFEGKLKSVGWLVKDDTRSQKGAQ